MKQVRGYVLILTAALLWGLSGTLAKILLSGTFDTLLLVQSRVTISFLALLLVFSFFKRDVFRVFKRDLLSLMALGILGVAGANFTYYYTIRESTVATAILLQYTAPLLVVIYAVMTKEEPVTLHKVTAALLSLLGCYYAVGGYQGALGSLTLAALVTGIGSAVCFAFLTLTTRHLLARNTKWTITLFSMGFASLFWAVVSPALEISYDGLDFNQWGVLAGFAIVSTLAPHLIFFAGLRHIVASRAMIVSSFEPIVAIVSASLLIGETLFYLQMFGALLVVGAIVFLELRREQPKISEVPQPSHGIADASQ